jgi:hypothetical protein
MSKDHDITYVISKELQDEGYGLVAIATKMFGYAAPLAEGEQYLMNPGTGLGFYVCKDDSGLEVGIMPFAIGSRSQMSAVRFVMEHGGVRSPLDVKEYVRAAMNNRTYTPR